MRRVFLDPDDTWEDWTMVVVAAPTGVVYEQQCGGVATEEREAEGYLVPLGGPKLDCEDPIRGTQLTAIFHRKGRCMWGASLSPERLVALRSLVAALPFWTPTLGGQDDRAHLVLDESRLHEIVEAWVPCVTPDGPGVLVWKNCD